MAQMNLTPLDSLVDDVWGKVGTPERDSMEKQLHEDVNLQIGERYLHHHTTNHEQNFSSARY